MEMTFLDTCFADKITQIFIANFEKHKFSLNKNIHTDTHTPKWNSWKFFVNHYYYYKWNTFYGVIFREPHTQVCVWNSMKLCWKSAKIWFLRNLAGDHGRDHWVPCGYRKSFHIICVYMCVCACVKNARYMSEYNNEIDGRFREVGGKGW